MGSAAALAPWVKGKSDSKAGVPSLSLAFSLGSQPPLTLAVRGVGGGEPPLEQAR